MPFKKLKTGQIVQVLETDLKKSLVSFLDLSESEVQEASFPLDQFDPNWKYLDNKDEVLKALKPLSFYNFKSDISYELFTIEERAKVEKILNDMSIFLEE
jgi:hypothetical protein